MGYSIPVGLRNFLYSRGWLTSHRPNTVVISIGNITVGGTGKTPLVIWLCKFLQEKGIRCGILTRGYRATQNSKLKTQNYADEPAILSQSCPQAKVIVNPDRVAGAAEAVNKFGAQALIMDDGFQHLRLARDLDIVTIDATQPFGYGKLLPAGLLREPVTALGRADAVVITRCDQVKESDLAELERKLQQINSNMIIARSIHAPIWAESGESKKISLESLKGRKVFAFCGIGNPQAFLNTINVLGFDVVGSTVYDDHHYYNSDDVAGIYEQAMCGKAELILTTHKDWTKIARLGALGKKMPLAYLAIALKFISGEDKVKDLIESTLADKIPAKKKEPT
jgi:tetraacyldisaccharide 4'-kinase